MDIRSLGGFHVNGNGCQKEIASVRAPRLSRLQPEAGLSNSERLMVWDPDMEALSEQQLAYYTCFKEQEAIMKLWAQISSRPRPAELRWHCDVCGEESQSIID